MRQSSGLVGAPSGPRRHTRYADYGLWANKQTYANRIPLEIVDVFERQGFIRGGTWSHFDTMHFEFRPELL